MLCLELNELKFNVCGTSVDLLDAIGSIVFNSGKNSSTLGVKLIVVHELNFTRLIGKKLKQNYHLYLKHVYNHTASSKKTRFFT